MTVRSAILAVAVLALAACGGSKHNSGSSPTVSAKSIGGAGTVLVDAQGDALYSPVEEQTGTIHCTAGCTTIWVPLTVQGGATPTAGSGVPGSLGTVKRPDGARQVTWNGKPLYTFAEDGGPGKVTGDGKTDSFSGMSFTWHVASTGMGSTPPASTSQGGGGGSYGY